MRLSAFSNRPLSPFSGEFSAFGKLTLSLLADIYSWCCFKALPGLKIYDGDRPSKRFDLIAEGSCSPLIGSVDLCFCMFCTATTAEGRALIYAVGSWL